MVVQQEREEVDRTWPVPLYGQFTNNHRSFNDVHLLTIANDLAPTSCLCHVDVLPTRAPILLWDKR
jgi:hypothetical protein